MEKHDRFDTLDHRPPTGRNLLLLGFWMRSTFIGALFAAAGVAALIGSPQGVSFLTALTWIAAGGTFAWLARQRTAALIDRVDADESTQADRNDVSPIRQFARLPVSSGHTPSPNRCQPEVSL
jgi:hypothetical protein